MKEPIQQMILSPETGMAVVKLTPAIGGGTWYALTLNQWVAIVTIIYIVLQVGLLIPSYINIYKTWKSKKDVK